MTDYIVNNTKTQTVKNYLRSIVGISLTSWRKLKRQGTLKVNGLAAHANNLVQAGDIITIDWPQECTIDPLFLPLNVVYEDDYLIIVNKPAGLLVHPTSTNGGITLANAVVYHYRQLNLNCGFHPVTRLDRNTSGLVLIAKTPHIHHLFNRNNIKHVTRTYWAFVTGVIDPPEGTITAPIGRKPGSIIERMVTPDGQHATTVYRLLQTFCTASLVELELLTGRTHQIRVHMAYLGYPLLGDDLYGGEKLLVNRQALHAARLKFKHPVTLQDIVIHCPLPDDMKQLMCLLDQSKTL